MNWVYDKEIYLEAGNHQQDMELMTDQRGSSVANVIKLILSLSKTLVLKYDVYHTQVFKLL
jgi:hypothetical protein